MTKRNGRLGSWCTIALAVAIAGGCSARKTNSHASSGGISVRGGALTSSNGLWANGLTTNGLWANGLWANGLWANGLWANGLWANGLWATDLTKDAAVPGNTLRSSVYARELLQYI